MSKNCIITTVKSKIKGNATSFIERETEIIIPVSNKFTLSQTRAIAIDKVNKINKEYLSKKFGDVVSLNTSYTDGTGINIHPSKRLVDAYEVKEGNKTLEEVNSGRDLNYFNGDVALYEQEQKDFENENNFKEEQKELNKIVENINNIKFDENGQGLLFGNLQNLAKSNRIAVGEIKVENKKITGFNKKPNPYLRDYNTDLTEVQAKKLFEKTNKSTKDYEGLAVYFANMFVNEIIDKDVHLKMGYMRLAEYSQQKPKILITDTNKKINPFYQYNNTIIVGIYQLQQLLENGNYSDYQKFQNLIQSVAQEESIHLFAEYLLSKETVDNIYSEMSEKDIQKIKDIYENENLDKNGIVHEYVRMVVQQHVFNSTTEQEKVKLTNSVLDFISKMINEIQQFLSEIIGQNNTQKAIEDVINFTKGNFSKELDEKIINRVFDKGQILEANLNVLNNFQEEQKELDKIVTKINNESRQSESFQNIITNENKPTPIDTTKSDGLLWGEMSSYESETNFQPTESKSQYGSDNSLQEKINGRSFKEIWNSNEFTQLERENILLHSIQERMLDKNTFNGELFAGINSKLGKLELRVVDNEKYPFLAFQKQIYINPKTFLKYLQNANIEDVDKYLDLTVSEELIHVLTNYFTSLEDIKKIATEINPNNFKYIQSIYKSLPSGDFELGTREYLRMIVQQEILGTTTEKIKYTKNGVIDSIIDKIWNFLYQIFKDNKGTLAENVKKHIDFIKSNNVDSTNNYKSDILQVETSLSQNIKYQLSKEQSDAIDNVFDENPEFSSQIYEALGFNNLRKEYSNVIIDQVWKRLASEGITNADSLIGTRETINNKDFNKFWSAVKDVDIQNVISFFESEKQKTLDSYSKYKGDFDPTTGTFTSNDTSFFDNKIKDLKTLLQQKQQAISLYSQYLEQNPNGSVEQFKSWVDEFNRNKSNLEQQSENKTIYEIYKEKPYLKDFIDSTTDESGNISIYKVKNTLDKYGEGRIVKLNKILYNAIYRLWDNNVFAQNNIKIKFVDSLPENAVGNFNRDNNEITIDKRKFLNNVINNDKNYPIFYLGYILNHEIIHYLTPKDLSLKIEYIDRALNGKFGDTFRLEHEREFGKNIKELYDVAIQKLDNTEDYGFLNLAEFVAEAMSNPSFQEKLASIPFKSSKQSLWKRFIEILSAYLSLYTKKPITDTLLEAVIAETTNYITENSNIQRTYKRKKSGKTENIDIGYDFVYTTQKNINSLSDFISQKSQERLNQIQEVFNENPELSKIGTVEQYSQYLEQNPNGSVEQFKSWVNNRNDLYYQVKNIFNAVKELEDKLKSLNKTANSIGSEKNIDDILKKAGLESDFRKEFLQLLKDNPSLKSLKLSEVISSYLKEFVKESDRQYYTAIEEPLSEELENVLIDYFDKFHIRRKQLDNLKEKFGVDSIGIFDVLAKTIYYSKNRNLLTLPEEYGHVFVELLGSISNKKADNPLFKYLFDNIESWDGYQRVFRDYKNLYVTAEGNIDIYKIKKEAIGQAIGIALVRNYKVQKGDKGFWSKIQEVIDYILGLIKGIDYVSLNTTVDNIAKDILSKNYSKLDRLKKDTSNYNLLSYSETIKNQNKKDGGKALKFMQWFSQKGMIITGSLAYRLQGNVYRPEIDALHDIDNIVPSDVHKLNLNKSNFLNEEQLEKDRIYRKLISEGNYKEAKSYKIQGNLKLDLEEVVKQIDVLQDFKKEFPDTDFLYSFFNQKANAYYVTINAIWSENQELKDRFKSYSGSFNNRLANFTEEELSQLYLFDFFLRPETSTQYKQIEDKEYGLNLAHFNYSFYEKLNMMGRPKDAYDYQMWDYFNEDNILAPDFNDRLVYFQINQSQQKQNQIQEVFNEYPELSKIGTVEQYASYLDTIKSNVILPTDRIVFGHPTIGKSYLKEQGENKFISLDDDYATEINNKVKEIANKYNVTTYQVKDGGTQKWNNEYNQMMQKMFNVAKQRAISENKTLFTSNTNLLKNNAESFDKVINLTDKEFERRIQERGAKYDTKEWKSQINEAISKLPANKVINTDKYLSDLFLGSKQDIEGFKEFVQGKQFQKLTAEEKSKTIEQVTKEHRSIAALKDLSAKLAHRIGGKVEFENNPNADWKGYNQGMTSVLNEAYMTPDTPFHEILAHPIIRAIKNRKTYYKTGETAEFHGYGEPYRVTIEKIYDNTLEADVIDEKGNKQKVDLFELSKTSNTLLYKSLLKELETGKGKEIFEQVKRDYTKKSTDVYKIIVDKLEKNGKIIEEAGKGVSAIEKYMSNIEGANRQSVGTWNVDVKYTLEEQQEEAIVQIIGLYSAQKLDKLKDKTLIQLIKELLKEMSDFVKLIFKKEINITKDLDNISELTDIELNKLLKNGEITKKC